MRRSILESDYYLPYMFKIQDSGCPTIRITVEADKPVAYVLVDVHNYFLFVKDQKYTRHMKGEPNMSHDITTTLPYAGKWYLIIMNRNITSVDNVHYSVEYLG